MKWFRFYTDTINNVKAQSLSPELFKFWVNLLCVTSQYEKDVTSHQTSQRASHAVTCASHCDGRLPPINEISFHLRMSQSDIKNNLDALIKANLIDDGEILKMHNWGKRQYKSDTSAERTRKYREKKKNKSGDVTDSVTNASQETSLRRPQNTDSESDTEDLKKKNIKKKKVSVLVPFPPDFCVTDKHREYASKNGLPSPDKEFEKFKNHHIGKASRWANWDLAFYNWLRQAKDFQRVSQTLNANDPDFYDSVAAAAAEAQYQKNIEGAIL